MKSIETAYNQRAEGVLNKRRSLTLNANLVTPGLLSFLKIFGTQISTVLDPNNPPQILLHSIGKGYSLAAGFRYIRFFSKLGNLALQCSLSPAACACTASGAILAAKCFSDLLQNLDKLSSYKARSYDIIGEDSESNGQNAHQLNQMILQDENAQRDTRDRLRSQIISSGDQ